MGAGQRDLSKMLQLLKVIGAGFELRPVVPEPTGMVTGQLGSGRVLSARMSARSGGLGWSAVREEAGVREACYMWVSGG